MKNRIEQIIDLIEGGQEITIYLNNKLQDHGAYSGTIGDEVLIKSQADGGIYGYPINGIDDIIPDNQEPAGDVVHVEFVDAKTDRKVAIEIDFSADEGKATVEFIPTVKNDEKGVYLYCADAFMKALFK